MGFVANVSENATAEEFCKSVNICESYKRMYSVLQFFDFVEWSSASSSQLICQTITFESLNAGSLYKRINEMHTFACGRP